MNRKIRDILKGSCCGAAVLFAVVFGFAAGYPMGANAEAAFAKLVDGEFVYYSDAECTQLAETPATGLAGVTVLFANDREYQELAQRADALTDVAAIALQNDLALTDDADWRAIDFDLNGKTITLMGWDLAVRKPKGEGRITAGNFIVNGGFEDGMTGWETKLESASRAPRTTASGDGVGTKVGSQDYPFPGNHWCRMDIGRSSSGTCAYHMKQEFLMPKERTCYVRFRYCCYQDSGYGQYISCGIDSTGTGNIVSNLRSGGSSNSPKPTNTPVYAKNLTADNHTIYFARYNGIALIDETTASPESHLIFDIPEGEEYANTGITLGSAETYFFDGIGLQVHKTGLGRLTFSKANATFGGPGATALVVEAGVAAGADELGCGEPGSRITVMDGAQFDTCGAVSSPSAFYDFTITGFGPDGLGAIVNHTEVAEDAAFIMRNVTLAGDASIGGTQPVNLKSGSGAATTVTAGGHTLTYTAPTVYAGNVTYSGGTVEVAEGAALVFNGNTSAAADCDVTIRGALHLNRGGFTTVKSLVFEEGATCLLSDEAGSENIPVTVVTERYSPNKTHTNGGSCTLTTPKVQLGDASHLETTFDLSRFEGVFDGTNTTFVSGSTVTVDLGTRAFTGSTLLVAWTELSSAVFAVDEANKDRLGLWARPDGLYVFPGKVPSFVKYDAQAGTWVYYDEEVNPYDGTWTLGMEYMRALFANDGEFQALAQHLDEIADNHVIVMLQDDITLEADADWRAIDFDLNGKTITLMGNTLKVHKPQGSGRITSGNYIVNGGFEDGATGWAFGTNSGTITASGSGVSDKTCKDKPFPGNHWCVIGTANNTAGATTLFTVPKEGVCYLRFRFAKYDSNYAEYGVNCGIDGVNNIAYHVNVTPYPSGKSSDVYKRTLTAGSHTFIFGRYYAYILVDEAAVSPESHLIFDIPEGEEYETTGITLGGTENYFFDGAGLKVHKTGQGTLLLTRPNGNFAGPGTTSLIVEEGLVVNRCADGQTCCGDQYSTIEVRDGARFDLNGHRYHDYDFVLSGSGPDGGGALVNSVGMANAWTVDGSSRGVLRNVTLAADAAIGATGDFGMIFYNNGTHTLTMADHTLTYAGTATIFGGQMNYVGDGKIVVAPGATLQSCGASTTADGCAMTIFGTLGQQDGKVISPVKSLIFAEGGTYFNLKEAPGTVLAYTAYAPNVGVGEGSVSAHPVVQLGDEEHLETTFDLSQWTETFDDSEEGSLTFQPDSTVTVEIGERTEGFGKPAFLWKEPPDETVTFTASPAMKRRGVFIVSRPDGLYFRTGFIVIIQ